MSEREIHRIRRKFIAAATLAFFLVMLLMGGMIYLFSSITARNEVRTITDYIIENDGDLPGPSHRGEPKENPESRVTAESAETNESRGTAESAENALSDRSRSLRDHLRWSLEDFFGTGNIDSGSEDFVYGTRYFAVLFDTEDQVESVKTSHIAAFDEAEAEKYARLAKKRFLGFGSFGTYYYRVADRMDGQGTIVVYLDRSSQLAVHMRILYVTLILLGFGTVVAFLIMRKLSYRIVDSELKNAEAQKQFITNASHELKTPLAVIKANTEMQEMLGEESEWTQSTLRQVSRMEGLIRNLVQIARSQERANAGELVPLDPAGPVKETAESFLPVARSEGKTLSVSVQEGWLILTEDSLLRQLVSLLTDNAVKYCDDGGKIGVSLNTGSRQVQLRVSNSYAEGAKVDYSRFFERFYREDESHHEKGGYGIGLSVAESLVKQMKGKISVAWEDGVITFTCSFPGRKKKHPAAPNSASQAAGKSRSGRKEK